MYTKRSSLSHFKYSKVKFQLITYKSTYKNEHHALSDEFFNELELEILN